MEFKYKITLDIKKESLLVGWLYSNAGRKEIISFEYVDLYLQNMHFVNIDPLLSKRTGRQFPPTHKNNFGFVEDISPDRWGRNLLKKMIGHTPSNIEAVTLTSDKIRLGAVRIWDLNTTPLSQEPSIPTLKNIKKLQALSRKAEGFSGDIKALYAPGSSLGYSDGMDAGSYVELAEFIGQNGRIEDAAQLWKRMVFSMLVSNFDDHLRNHGFLLRDGE